MVIEPFPEDRFMDQFAVITTSWEIVIKYCDGVRAYPSTDTIVTAINGNEVPDGVVGDSIVITTIDGGRHNFINMAVVVLVDDGHPGYRHVIGVAKGDLECVRIAVDVEDIISTLKCYFAHDVVAGSHRVLSP